LQRLHFYSGWGVLFWLFATSTSEGRVSVNATEPHLPNKPVVVAKNDETVQKKLRVLKGTTFFGGSGMKGAYIDDMVKALEEQGINNVRAADPKIWSRGSSLNDALAVPFENSRDDKQSDFSKFGEEGDQFNLIGYSYGGLQAAQGAIDYADQGGTMIVSADNIKRCGYPVCAWSTQ